MPDLNDANFRFTTLADAVLFRAKLTGANLGGADLATAKNLAQ